MDVAELAQRLYAALDEQDWDQVGRLVHPEVVVQVDSFPATTLDAWRAGQRRFHEGFPDGRHVIEQSLVSGEHVVTRCRYEGTHRGWFAATEPTGRSVAVRVIHIDRFVDGLLIEHRGQLDMLGLLTQIGASPS